MSQWLLAGSTYRLPCRFSGPGQGWQVCILLDTWCYGDQSKFQSFHNGNAHPCCRLWHAWLVHPLICIANPLFDQHMLSSADGQHPTSTHLRPWLANARPAPFPPPLGSYLYLPTSIKFIKLNPCSASTTPLAIGWRLLARVHVLTNALDELDYRGSPQSANQLALCSTTFRAWRSARHRGADTNTSQLHTSTMHTHTATETRRQHTKMPPPTPTAIRAPAARANPSSKLVAFSPTAIR